MNSETEYLIESDILVDHLKHKGETQSVLEKAMQNGTCFTTMINASEIYFAVENENERNAVDKLMRSLKILGLNSRYSLVVNEFTGKVESTRDAIFCAVAKINKLPVLTNNTEKYKLAGIEIINPQNL